MLHIHWDTYSSDCDGPLERHRISEPGGWGDTPDEVLRTIVASYYHDCKEDGWGVRLGAWCDEYEHDRSLRIHPTLEPREDEDSWPHVKVIGWRIDTSAPHEEGGSSEEIVVCTDESCMVGESSQRDYAAEAMGY